MTVIKKLSKERSVLLISHRLANVVDSVRIYTLQEGRILEGGSHKELLVENGLYAKLYMEQKKLEAYAAGTEEFPKATRRKMEEGVRYA